MKPKVIISLSAAAAALVWLIAHACRFSYLPPARPYLSMRVNRWTGETEGLGNNGGWQQLTPPAHFNFGIQFSAGELQWLLLFGVGAILVVALYIRDRHRNKPSPEPDQRINPLESEFGADVQAAELLFAEGVMLEAAGKLSESLEVYARVTTLFPASYHAGIAIKNYDRVKNLVAKLNTARRPDAQTSHP